MNRFYENVLSLVEFRVNKIVSLTFFVLQPLISAEFITCSVHVDVNVCVQSCACA